MYAGVAFFGAVFYLAMLIGIIVFAVKLLGRLKEISHAQQSIAQSQAQLVNVLAKQKTSMDNTASHQEK